VSVHLDVEHCTTSGTLTAGTNFSFLGSDQPCHWSTEPTSHQNLLT